MQERGMQPHLIFQVLGQYDSDEVYRFAMDRLIEAEPDESTRTFLSWSAKWRQEALSHYLPLGWSFIARENGTVRGFFLAQPLLFFRGQTQTLWIEHVEAISQDVAEALIDVAIRVAREKHLQRVLFFDQRASAQHMLKWGAQALTDEITEVRTTKG